MKLASIVWIIKTNLGEFGEAFKERKQQTSERTEVAWHTAMTDFNSIKLHGVPQLFRYGHFIL